MSGVFELKLCISYLRNRFYKSLKVIRIKNRLMRGFVVKLKLTKKIYNIRLQNHCSFYNGGIKDSFSNLLQLGAL